MGATPKSTAPVVPEKSDPATWAAKDERLSTTLQPLTAELS